jgi:hypothetical protein
VNEGGATSHRCSWIELRGSNYAVRCSWLVDQITLFVARCSWFVVVTEGALRIPRGLRPSLGQIDNGEPSVSQSNALVIGDPHARAVRAAGAHVLTNAEKFLPVNGRRAVAIGVDACDAAHGDISWFVGRGSWGVARIKWFVVRGTCVVDRG